jgi:hypothetical protein
MRYFALLTILKEITAGAIPCNGTVQPDKPKDENAAPINVKYEESSYVAPVETTEKPSYDAKSNVTEHSPLEKESSDYEPAKEGYTANAGNKSYDDATKVSEQAAPVVKPESNYVEPSKEAKAANKPCDDDKSDINEKVAPLVKPELKYDEPAYDSGYNDPKEYEQAAPVVKPESNYDEPAYDSGYNDPKEYEQAAPAVKESSEYEPAYDSGYNDPNEYEKAAPVLAESTPETGYDNPEVLCEEEAAAPAIDEPCEQETAAPAISTPVENGYDNEDAAPILSDAFLKSITASLAILFLL